jgi:hypothetical protein
MEMSMATFPRTRTHFRKYGQSAAEIYRTTEKMLDPAEQARGVGDDACWGSPGLDILKGDVYVLVSVGNTSKPENVKLALCIAKKVLPHL